MTLPYRAVALGAAVMLPLAAALVTWWTVTAVPGPSPVSAVRLGETAAAVGVAVVGVPVVGVPLVGAPIVPVETPAAVPAGRAPGSGAVGIPPRDPTATGDTPPSRGDADDRTARDEPPSAAGRGGGEDGGGDGGRGDGGDDGGGGRDGGGGDD